MHRNIPLNIWNYYHAYKIRLQGYDLSLLLNCLREFNPHLPAINLPIEVKLATAESFGRDYIRLAIPYQQVNALVQ